MLMSFSGGSFFRLWVLRFLCSIGGRFGGRFFGLVGWPVVSPVVAGPRLLGVQVKFRPGIPNLVYQWLGEMRGESAWVGMGGSGTRHGGMAPVVYKACTSPM